MKIKINFQGGWENSFVEGSIDDFGQKRKYIGSGKGGFENYKDIKTTKNTVLGILYRLIGDQRKLIQIKNDSNPYFKELDPFIEFEEESSVDEETVYLRNSNSDVFDRNGFSGPQKIESTELFDAKYFNRIWGVLSYSVEELMNLIISGKETICAFPKMDRIKIGILLATKIDKNKKYNEEKETKVHNNEELIASLIRRNFISPEERQNVTPYKMLVFCGIYCVLENILSEEPSFKKNLSAKGKISGLAYKSFTLKDFLSAIGEKKKIIGNPSKWEGWTLGNNNKKIKQHLHLKRKRGTLTIHLNIDKEKELELRELIESAGVGSFVLGKKGLAYIDSIWS